VALLASPLAQLPRLLALEVPLVSLPEQVQVEVVELVVL
jgi:ABC-type cobalamin/Fe3+-siderophores transport system ATPase subunit